MADSTSSAPPPSKFALEDFKKLAWLEGSWRGRMSNGKPFHESYQVVNDSTMLQGSYTDSTFKTKSDSAVIAYREGTIVDQGGGPAWQVSSLDSTMVDFQSPQDPTAHFSWTRDTPDRWTARIYSTGAGAVEKVTVYVMERVRR